MRAYFTIGRLAVVTAGLLIACNDPGAQQPYREENTGETVTGDEVNVLESIPEGLTLVDYELESQTGRISGSLMNNDTIPFVNVQIAFEVYDSQDNLVATVRDTTSEVQPGDTWQFGLVTPADDGAVRAVPIEVQGIPRRAAGEHDESADQPPRP